MAKNQGVDIKDVATSGTCYLSDNYDVEARRETKGRKTKWIFLKILAEVTQGISTHFLKEKETPPKGCYYDILVWCEHR